MRTALAMTKSTVSNRSFHDRPRPPRLVDRPASPAPSSTFPAVEPLCTNLSPEFSKEFNDASVPARRQTRAVKGLGDAPRDLCTGGIGRHERQHRFNTEAIGDGERPEGYLLAGIVADDRGPEEAATPAGDDLDEAGRQALCLGTIVLDEGEAKDANLAVALQSFGRTEPDPGEARVGEGDPRHVGRAVPRGKPEEDRPENASDLVVAAIDR